MDGNRRVTTNGDITDPELTGLATFHLAQAYGVDDVENDRVFAFAMAPDGFVRAGSLHNQVTLLCVDEATMSEKTRRYAAGPSCRLPHRRTTSTKPNNEIRHDGQIVKNETKC